MWDQEEVWDQEKEVWNHMWLQQVVVKEAL